MKSDKLNPRQRKAVVSFLEEPTIAAAAQAAGVTENTLFRWLDQDPDFANAVRDARKHAVERAIGRLAGAAVDAVEWLANDPDTPARVRIQTATALLSGLEALRG